MNHEFLWLNNKRQYLLLDNGTWYDASVNFVYKPGDLFLTGKVQEILSYEDYIDRFPEVQKIDCKYESNSISGIYARLTNHGVVLYNYDNRKPITRWNRDEDIQD